MQQRGWVNVVSHRKGIGLATTYGRMRGGVEIYTLYADEELGDSFNLEVIKSIDRE